MRLMTYFYYSQRSSLVSPAVMVSSLLPSSAVLQGEQKCTLELRRYTIRHTTDTSCISASPLYIQCAPVLDASHVPLQKE